MQAITVGRPSRSAICGQAQVVGPEVVPPLRDAVRLVDREQVDPPLRERVEEDGRGEALRRAVDDPRLAAADLRRARARAASSLIPEEIIATGCPAAVSRRHWSFISAISGLTTIVRSSRRQPRQLVAEALAAAGRHHDQRVAPLQRRLDRLALPGPPALEPELPEQLVGAVSVRGHPLRLCAGVDAVCVCR